VAGGPKALWLDSDSNMIDTASEMRAAELCLARRGGPPSDLVLFTPLGLASVEVDGDRWQSAPHGPEMLIVPVYDTAPPSFATPPAGEPEPPIDLVAFRLDRPQRWHLRTGLAKFLGEHLLAEVLWIERARRVRVVSTPRQYLLAKCRAICPLTADFEELREVPRLLVDDVAFAEEIEHRLLRPRRMPEILVRPAA
jgi:hypothetical protein